MPLWGSAVALGSLLILSIAAEAASSAGKVHLLSGSISTSRDLDVGNGASSRSVQLLWFLGADESSSCGATTARHAPKPTTSPRCPVLVPAGLRREGACSQPTQTMTSGYSRCHQTSSIKYCPASDSGQGYNCFTPCQERRTRGCSTPLLMRFSIS